MLAWRITKLITDNPPFPIMQSCIDVLARPAKKVKAAPTNENVASSSTLFPSTKFTVSQTSRTIKRASSQLRNACGAVMKPPVSSSETAPSATTSTVNGRYTKANLPLELLADSKWQRVLIPTLLLWAGGSDDVWSVTRGAVAYALPLIVDSSHEADLSSESMDFSWQGPIVSVVRPDLCSHDLTLTNSYRRINVCVTGDTISAPPLSRL